MANHAIHLLIDLLIPSEQADAARTGLEEISLEAAELAWKFWTRKFDIVVLNMKDMTGTTKAIDGHPPVLRFSSTSSSIEASSALHNFELDGDPTALDGADVLLLCSPLVLANDTAEGTGYDQGRPWKKAVAVLGPRPDGVRLPARKSIEGL